MCAQLYSTQLRETMADWDRDDVFSLAPSMHPPRFMWKEEGDTYDVEKEKGVIREHYDKAVGVLNGGAGYDTLRGMKERLEAHHNRAKEAASGYESRRNYAQLQFGIMKQKVISIARERVEREDDEAVQEEANEIIDEPMGAYWRTEEGKPVSGGAPNAVWSTGAIGYNTDERWADGIPLSDMNIYFKPENNTHYKEEFEEDDLHRTDQRLFDGDETWRDALESIQRRWERVEEQHERAVNTKELLRFRLGVIKTVLYRFEAYGSVEKMSDTEAGDIARDRRRDASERIMGWQKNAAQMYAYVQKYDAPSSKSELEEKAEVSTRQAFDRLKERGYGTGTGVSGLVSALQEWASEFEKQYGVQKARKAAHPFIWPDEHEE